MARSGIAVRPARMLIQKRQRASPSASGRSLRMPLANPYVQRIPADVKPKTPGLTLDIPVGDTLTPYTITAAAQAIRLSLKTTDARERKARALKVSAFLETVWNALRRNELVPQSL